MRPVLFAVVLAACAAPRAEEPAAAVAPAEVREGLPKRDPDRPLYAADLAKRFRERALRREAPWPRRSELPKPEERYDVAFLWMSSYGCAEYSEVLVDLEDPRIFWIRVTGGIRDVREYLGPAEILNEAGPLEFRILE